MLRHGSRLMALSLLAACAASATAASPEPTYGHDTPEAARSALNREQAQTAQAQLADNVASAQSFADAQATRDQQMRQEREAYEAENARVASEHDAALARWREAVAACRAGDRTQCRHR